MLSDFSENCALTRSQSRFLKSQNSSQNNTDFVSILHAYNINEIFLGGNALSTVFLLTQTPWKSHDAAWCTGESLGVSAYVGFSWVQKMESVDFSRQENVSVSVSAGWSFKQQGSMAHYFWTINKLIVENKNTFLFLESEWGNCVKIVHWLKCANWQG